MRPTSWSASSEARAEEPQRFVSQVAFLDLFLGELNGIAFKSSRLLEQPYWVGCPSELPQMTWPPFSVRKIESFG